MTDERLANGERLLAIASTFEQADAALDQWVADEGRLDDPQFLELHRRWEDALSRAAAVKAGDAREFFVKVRILLAALKVAQPGDTVRQPHDDLADSLARDLLHLEGAEECG